MHFKKNISDHLVAFIYEASACKHTINHHNTKKLHRRCCKSASSSSSLLHKDLPVCLFSFFLSVLSVCLFTCLSLAHCSAAVHPLDVSILSVIALFVISSSSVGFSHRAPPLLFTHPSTGDEQQFVV